MGDFVSQLHEEHGVIFHLEDTATAIDGRQVKLKNGGSIDAELVVAGVGVRPRIALAEAPAWRSIAAWSSMNTSKPARPEFCGWGYRALAGSSKRRVDSCRALGCRGAPGPVAALNMLGRREEFDAVPFFWSQHYDVPINYVGHAESWDELTKATSRRGLSAAISAQRPRPRRGFNLPRRREPAGRTGNGAGNRLTGDQASNDGDIPKNAHCLQVMSYEQR